MVLEKIKAILSEQFSVDESEISADTLLEDDLGADSLDIFQIVLALEEEFKVKISENEAEKIRTVQEAVDLIKGIQD